MHGVIFTSKRSETTYLLHTQRRPLSGEVPSDLTSAKPSASSKENCPSHSTRWEIMSAHAQFILGWKAVGLDEYLRMRYVS